MYAQATFFALFRGTFKMRKSRGGKTGRGDAHTSHAVTTSHSAPKNAVNGTAAHNQ